MYQRTRVLCNKNSTVSRTAYPSVFTAVRYSHSSTIELVNPATGKRTSHEQDSAQTVASKYQTVRDALSSPGLTKWNNTPAHRVQVVGKNFIEQLEKNEERAAKALSEDMGKSVKQARNEVRATKARVQFFVDNVDKVMADEVIKQDAKLKEVIKWEPLGVVANISAWNYPYFVGSNVFVPALMTGNSVLYKPSEFTLRTGKIITEMLYASGVPEQFFQTVYGGGAVGSLVLDHKVDGVFFTGSVGTGKKIYQKAASYSTHMPKVQLELGGKDATYVMPPVDIKSAAESLADGAMYNTGQSCCSVERIYVHSDIYDEFVAELVRNVRLFKTGPPDSEDTYIGPLVQDKQRDLLDAHIADAVSKGAKIETGGKRVSTGPGFYYEPTVLSGCTNDMLVMRDESFGPIVGVAKVRDEDEAVRLINDSQYGLTNGVYTSDKAAARRIMGKLHSGSVYWNACDRIAFGLPWSGRNLSGLGLTLSTHGIRAFMQPKGYHIVGQWEDEESKKLDAALRF
eukprot:TRINITY_DN1811_c0_g1_i1.p1 TRINITY_DN1811_c0_g1~~TRINITY_DN1811_c0_g1_i1.p1  ORF type:complete len:512 (+),score=88.91 TRINITY_DN1811_c0_g1_i1:49-1584(+)